MKINLQKFVVPLIAILFLKLFFQSEFGLLIHPRFLWMMYFSIPILILFSYEKKESSSGNPITLLIILTFLIAIIFPLKPLSSFTAKKEIEKENLISYEEILRGKFTTKYSFDTKNWGIKQWSYQLALNTSIEDIIGKEVNVEGFYFEDSEGIPKIGKYTLQCCAADSRILSIPLSATPTNTTSEDWISIQGVIEEKDGKPVVKIIEMQKIDAPKNPYETTL